MQRLLQYAAKSVMQEASLLYGLPYSACPGAAGCDMNVRLRRCSHELESGSTAEQGAAAASVQLACRSTRILVAESECKWQPNIPPAAAPVAAPAELARWLCGRAQLNPYKRTAT